MNNMEIIFIIGLSGSGKSILLDHYKSHPFIEYKIYDDWMVWTMDDMEKRFDADIKYGELIDDLNKKSNIVISGIEFCRDSFLCDSESILKSRFPNIKIKRIYFENNMEFCINNIEYRDEGEWFENDEGVSYYVGQISLEGYTTQERLDQIRWKAEGMPLYKVEIEKTREISKNYIIPDEYNPLKIVKM